MKAVVQRVTHARVTIGGRIYAEIGSGLLVLLGVEKTDTGKQAEYLAEKVVNLRIFEDEKGKMNVSVKDINGELLVVSQFTLLGDCRKGRRPSFTGAAPPDTASALYEHFVRQTREMGIPTRTGRFQAVMDVGLTNSGPVTVLLDTDHVA